MIRFQKIGAFALVMVAGFTACKKDTDPIIVVPPSSGSTITANGLVGTEAGSSAGNAVFIDLSSDKQVTAERKNWDLGFYAGSDFRVIINNTTTATAKVTAKTDINTVGSSDTAGLNGLSIGFDTQSWALIDDSLGNLNNTVIPFVSATDADNKVVIINRGTGGSTPAREWYKVRILRNGSNGYTLQYATLTATTFTSLPITKDANYNFQYVSFDNGLTAVEPEKEKWDFKWSYSLYKTFYADPSVNAFIPYAFSDFITINNRAGVQAAIVDTNVVKYSAFTIANISALGFSDRLDVIGDKWRKTAGSPLGIQKNLYMIVKDPAGNHYKLRFLEMGVGGDGGTRGKPKFEYALIQ